MPFIEVTVVIMSPSHSMHHPEFSCCLWKSLLIQFNRIDILVHFACEKRQLFKLILTKIKNEMLYDVFQNEIMLTRKFFLNQIDLYIKISLKVYFEKNKIKMEMEKNWYEYPFPRFLLRFQFYEKNFINFRTSSSTNISMASATLTNIPYSHVRRY